MTLAGWTFRENAGRVLLLRVPARVWFWAGMALAGASMSLVFAGALAAVPAESWAHRDDGIITMSHARNLVDFGFVGVNPSGERVEGYSAPLQLVLFAAAYALTHVGYARFADLQTAVSGVGLGAALFWIFFVVSRRVSLSLAGVVVAALLLKQSATFLLWHGSGMENAVTHVLYVGTWAVLLAHLERPRVAIGWAIVPLLAAWSRFESILHIAPMLAAFAWLHFRAFGNSSGLRLLGAFLGGWVLLFLGRAFYFGHWVPNTAYAQDIALSTHLEWLLLGRMPPRSTDQVWSAYRSTLGPLLLFTIPLLAVVRATPLTRMVGVLAALAALAAALNGYLFSGARLDPARTTTFLAPLAVAAVIALALALPGLRARLAVLVLLASPPLGALLRVPPYELCCSASLFEDNLREFRRMQASEGLPRPLVASPDLGGVSFSKEFNILDLGYLGSTVLPQLSDDASTHDYVFRIAAPDFIELHANWAKTHKRLLSDARFAELYEPWTPLPSAFISGYCGGNCFWVRKSTRRGAPGTERALIDVYGASHDAAELARAVVDCNASTEPDACLYVVRTVYRFLPDLDPTQAASARATLGQIRDPRQQDLSEAIVESRSRGTLSTSVRRYLSGAS